MQMRSSVQIPLLQRHAVTQAPKPYNTYSFPRGHKLSYTQPGAPGLDTFRNLGPPLRLRADMLSHLNLIQAGREGGEGGGHDVSPHSRLLPPAHPSGLQHVPGSHNCSQHNPLLQGFPGGRPTLSPAWAVVHSFLLTDTQGGETAVHLILQIRKTQAQRRSHLPAGSHPVEDGAWQPGF